MNKEQLNSFNKKHLDEHKINLDYLTKNLSKKSIDLDLLTKRIGKFQISIPSWALGTGGTRFGRFPIGGEPISIEDKINDVGLIHSLNKSSNAISLHIPWDIPRNHEKIKSLAKSLEIKFDAVNSNTFQDQPKNHFSYKHGSLSHINKSVREQAINHNKEVIDHGIKLGSKALTIWLADGTSFPGQHNFSDSFQRTLESLHEIYSYLPKDWKLLIEYKPYEPNFYSMVIPDWGTSYVLSDKLGNRATSLVDLGHHLPNTNIEQIVAILIHLKKLGGFHFNDSKYGDDDLSVGSIKPYQLFLIFCELVKGIEEKKESNLSWMIDASHNLKDPLEDLLQSVENIKISFAKALLVDYEKLKSAQKENDVTSCQSILQEAFNLDVRPLVVESRLQHGGAIKPLEAFRKFNFREKLIKLRGVNSKSTGL